LVTTVAAELAPAAARPATDGVFAAIAVGRTPARPRGADRGGCGPMPNATGPLHREHELHAVLADPWASPRAVPDFVAPAKNELLQPVAGD
jgi:hypothetical protein